MTARQLTSRLKRLEQQSAKETAAERFMAMFTPEAQARLCAEHGVSSKEYLIFAGGPLTILLPRERDE